MDQYSRGIGETTRCMAGALKLGRMVVIMRGSLNQISTMDMGFILGQMAYKNIKGSGNLVSSTD